MRVCVLVLIALTTTSAACRRPRPMTEVARAVADGDDAALGRLLSSGHSPDEGSPRPIVFAARSDNDSAIAMLISAGASPNQPDGGNGWTPLQHAVHKRAARAVAALLKGGADPNLRAPGSVPPLMMAAGYGDVESFAALLEGGADPAFELEPGINSLWAALGGGAISDITDGPPLGSCFPTIVTSIKEHAPSLRLRNNGETKALRFMAQKGCAELIDANLS